MKKNRKIVFEIILFLAVLFCFGINTYSHSCSVEHSTGTNCIENIFMSDIDHVEDDQLIHNSEFKLISSSIDQIPVSQERFIIPEYSLSVWQPPKLS